MIAESQTTLPHFNKILAGELLDQPQHFQFEEGGNHLRGRDIFHFLKQIVQMYRCVHLQRLERPAGGGAQLGGGLLP